MPEKEKKSFFSRFRRSKPKDIEIKFVSAQKQESGPPPAYWNIAFDYKNFEKKAQKLVDSNAKHEKKQELIAMRDEKGKLDKRYEEAMGTAVSMEGLVSEELADEREDMVHSKEAADLTLQTAETKASKNIEAREALEKHRETTLVRVIKHAATVKKNDAAVAAQTQAAGNQAQGAGNQAQGAGNQTPSLELEAQKAKNAKKESRDSKMEKAGFASTISNFLGTVFGSIADGIETLSNAGVETKKSLDALKSGEKGKREFLKENSTNATGGLGIAAAGLSLINGIISMVELGRGLVKTIKHSWKGTSDRQEKWLDARTILEKICETVSNLIGAVAPFTTLVPFLGSSLGIADSGIQMVVGSMNLATNAVHATMMRHDKEKLWKEIERKRKKYAKAGSDDVVYFDVESVVGSYTAGQKSDRKQKFSDIDLKRREMLKVVSEEQKIAKRDLGTRPSKNASEFARAEMEISTRMSAMRKEWHEGKSGMDRKNYKKAMHQMEALQLMSQYRTAEKAAKKMHKAVGHDVEGLITNGTKIVGNALSLSGQITAASGFGATLIAAGVGVNLAEGAYEQGRTAGSFLYKQFRKFSGAEANKKNTRAEMGAYLYDKMLSLDPDHVEWEGHFFKLDDSVPDYRVREESKSMNELYSIVRRGLDARVSTLLGAATAADMKGALAEAFGQED